MGLLYGVIIHLVLGAERYHYFPFVINNKKNTLSLGIHEETLLNVIFVLIAKVLSYSIVI